MMWMNLCFKPTLTIPRCSSLPPPTNDHGGVGPTKQAKISSKSPSVLPAHEVLDEMPLWKKKRKGKRKKRVFFLDVNPLCYKGRTPSSKSFAHWASLLFSITRTDPLIAVLDGAAGSERRRALLPSYKANRQYFTETFIPKSSVKGHLGRSQGVVDVLEKCNVPVVRVDGYEADDVVATLTEQVLHRGYKVVIASPDKDFKQLISDDVQMVLPITELNRWSFYTKENYIARHNCDPLSDLSLRSIMGDEADNVPGLQTMVPGFGRKTCIKLLQKHGTLDNLLNAAAVRTVGKQYVQNAITKHADFLRRNYNVLALKRDVNVDLKEEWLVDRDGSNDSFVLSSFLRMLEGRERTAFLGRPKEEKEQFDMVDAIHKIVHLYSDQGRNKSN